MAAWNTRQGFCHPANGWTLDPVAAAEMQNELALSVAFQPFRKTAFSIAGIDSGYRGKRVCAAVVVMRFPELEIVETCLAERKENFAYRTGLLAFREGPAIMDALLKLKARPDLLLLDGQGIAHPRRFGIASHIGFLSDFPAIGCAKTHLVGHYQDPGTERGSFSLLTISQEKIGAVVRTRSRIRPVFVSVGHRIELADCIRIVLDCCRRYRLPEPIRQAHRAATVS